MNWTRISILLVATVGAFANSVNRRDVEDHADCSDIQLPHIQEFEVLKNEANDIIGYRLVLTINTNITIHPTWHRFHEIPQVRSHEFNYPLPTQDPDFLIKTHYPLTNVLETSVAMVAEYDGSTRYGLQLDMTSKCGPITLYLKVDKPDFAKLKTFPTIHRKAPSVAEIPKVCEDQSIYLEQTTEIKYENLTIDGTAGLTRILGKRVGINDMEEIYEAYEFNPSDNAEYNLDSHGGELKDNVVTQSWKIFDVRKENYVGLYQFYVSLDTQDKAYKKDPNIYMLSMPFVVKPEHYEATSVGIHPCYPFRNSVRHPGEEPPIKHLGTVDGYRPCFRVLVQTSEPIRLKLSPYEDSPTNPQPSYSGPVVGGMQEFWYVLDDDRIPSRENDYQLYVSTDDYTYIIPFRFTKYTPAQPGLNIKSINDEEFELTCTATGFPQPKVDVFEMNKYNTLGGDTHWDLDRLLYRFYPLQSKTTFVAHDNKTQIWTRQKSMIITKEQKQRLIDKTYNRAMPYGIACIAWNDFSHNIAFWSPVLPADNVSEAVPEQPLLVNEVEKEAAVEEENVTHKEKAI